MLLTHAHAAAAAGQFHIHTVDNVDQAIELLTGVEAGVADETGNYPEGSVNQRVAERLSNFAKAREKHEDEEEKE